MPSYWIKPCADLAPPGDVALSETFYGLIGAADILMFEAFPPIFTQIQRLAGVAVDDLLPLSVNTYRPTLAEQQARTLAVRRRLPVVHRRSRALYEGLLGQPGWGERLVYPPAARGVYLPPRDYMVTHPPVPAPVGGLAADWDEDAGADEEPTLGSDLRSLLGFLSAAEGLGARWFWLLCR